MLKVVINHGHHIVKVGQPVLDNQPFFKNNVKWDDYKMKDELLFKWQSKHL